MIPSMLQLATKKPSPPVRPVEEQMKPRLIVRLKGGLGNQLFQYAAARGIAERNGAPLYLDAHTGFASDAFARHFRLNHFAIHAAVLSEEECRHVLDTSYLSRRFRSYRERCLIRYLGRAFDPFTYRLKVGRDVVLEGFWQSERYFRHVTSALRRELTVVTAISAETREIMGRIRTEGGVAVHIRRLHGYSAHGTRVEGKYGGEAAHMSLAEYYRRSIEYIRGVRGSISAYVFADSPEWAAENVRFDCPTTYVSHNREDRDYEDLLLMATCRDHVIANSSFSWWGAWLGQTQDKIVCAPRNFSPYQGMRVLLDVYPPSWVVM
jgi:hypothetical protein